MLSVRGGADNVTGERGVRRRSDARHVGDEEHPRGPAASDRAAEAGCLWREFDHETHAFGLAVTGGQASGTGIAGLTLGGGVGQLMRCCGATVDNRLYTLKAGGVS